MTEQCTKRHYWKDGWVCEKCGKMRADHVEHKKGVIMSDISKCHGEDCEIKEKCYRYTSPSGDWQTWIAPCMPGKECMYFWPNEQRR